MYNITLKSFWNIQWEWLWRWQHIVIFCKSFLAICTKFDYFWTVGFSFISLFFFQKRTLRDNSHSFVYKIRPKHSLRFLMPWSQREWHFATIFSWIGPKMSTWGIISIPLSIRSNQNIFFVFLCMSDTLQPCLVDLGQIWSFLDRCTLI